MEDNTQKKSRAVPAMIVISVSVLVLGILCAGGLYSALSAEIAGGAGEQLVVGGTDIAPVIGASGRIGAMVLSCLLVAASMILVMIQWIVYAVIRFIVSAVKNNKN